MIRPLLAYLVYLSMFVKMKYLIHCFKLWALWNIQNCDRYLFVFIYSLQVCEGLIICEGVVCISQPFCNSHPSNLVQIINFQYTTSIQITVKWIEDKIVNVNTTVWGVTPTQLRSSLIYPQLSRDTFPSRDQVSGV
jgi:hypothetical protein